MRENSFVGRRLFGFSLHFALDLAEHDEFICVGLLATAIDFQIAKDKRAFAIAFEKDEWIGRPKFRRIEHIGIRLAGGDDEAGWFCLSLAHLYRFFFYTRLRCMSSRAKRGTSHSFAYIQTL